MHLQLSPDAPAIARLGADALLATHIGAGCLGLASGFAAFAFRKGGRLHRLTGTTFLASMLTTLTIGAAVAPFVGQPMNLISGVFSIYLVVSGWATAKRKGGAPGRLDLAALAVPLIAAPLLVWAGWIGAHSPHGEIQGVPFQAAYITAALATFCAALDLKVVAQRGVAGTARVTRHLWRMCVALFFASASLFIGQPQVFPKALQGSPLLAVAAFAPLVLMIFWLLRVRFARAFRATMAPRAVAAPAN